MPSDSTKSSQHAMRMPSPNQPCADSCTLVSSEDSAIDAMCTNGWCSMPPNAPRGQPTDTAPNFGPNRYGPSVCSNQSNAATRCAVPACAFASSFGRYHTEICVPAVVVPSGSSVYASYVHAN
ncbi:MAG: hypothetical protein ACM31C_19800 [Acidobacteriota bacterium]